MNINTWVKLTIVSLLISISNISTAKEIFTHEDKTEIINKLAKSIKDNYVLIDEGLKFSEELLYRHKQGEYGKPKSKNDFVELINKSLYQISKDKHLSLRSESESPSPRMMRRRMSPQQINSSDSNPKRIRRMPANSTQALRKSMGLNSQNSLSTEILPGNIGLLTINDLMAEPSEADKSMLTLADTDGLIIDVRGCPGGRGDTANQISSYFVAEGEEIMRMHTRDEDVTINRSAKLPKGSKRYLGKPFYLVTSNFTGSACEALSFALKYHDLGVIYGENTAGAGHAATRGLIPMGFGLAAFIPNSRPEHPKHKGGFEKVGVTADIQAGVNVSVDLAYQMILTQLMEKNKGDNVLGNTIINITNKINHTLMKQFEEGREYSYLVGNYADQFEIVLDQGILRLVTASKRRLQLSELSDDQFTMGLGMRKRELKIVRNSSGKIKGISLSPRRNQKEWLFKEKI